MSQALITFHRDLNASELRLYENNPERILLRISDGLKTISQAILAEPTLSHAWVVKGRYHLACMEAAQAKEAFLMAETSAETRRAADQPDLLGPEQPAALAAIADQLIKPSSDRFEKGATLLERTGTPGDEVAAGVLRFLRDKPIARRASLGSSPTARFPGPEETAVNVIAANGGRGQLTFADAGRELTLAGFERLSDLSQLRSLTPPRARLVIRDAAALDWPTLAALPIESLDLSGCPTEGPSLMLRGFAKMQSLSLKETRFSDLSFLRLMPFLTSLDISGTSVAELGLLATNRRIQSLDISRLSLENVRALLFLPLARLTLSPMMISDKASLNSLRGLRTLRVLRSPTDPEDQPPAEFWRKLAAGEYDTGT